MTWIEDRDDADCAECGTNVHLHNDPVCACGDARCYFHPCPICQTEEVTC